MVLGELCTIVNGTVICGDGRMKESVEYGFASDLMSDVLTIKSNEFILITGLANVQCIRTAEMSDISFILLARGKEVTEEMKELAEDSDMVIISTPFSVFKCAGMLYSSGLKPVY